MVSFTGALMVPKKTVRCHGGIPEMVSSNFHGTLPIWLFSSGTNMFCGVWHFAKQSVAAWIVLDGVQDYETKCASLMSDGKSWKAHWRKTKILLGHTHVKPREWELHLGGYFNLHCCMTLPQHHECMTPSRHQCCDTIEASLLWHHLGIMLWHHRGITSLTPFRHHFFDAIEASFLWHHCGITYLTPLRHHYDTIKKSFLWHHCGITYLTPQRYHYDSIKASFLWHHWGITSLTPLRHHCDTIKAPFLWHHCGITSLAPQSIMTPLRHHFCDTTEASLLWHHWGITMTSLRHQFLTEAEAKS